MAIRKSITEQLPKFILFAFPCYWTLSLLFIALVVWKTALNDPDVITVMLITAVVIAAAVMLMHNYYWISIPMAALGIYIALQDDQHVGTVFTCYGIYLVLHYAVCGIHVYRNRKKE